MSSLLVRNAEVLVTHDAARREIAGGGFHARDGIITQVGPTAELPVDADEILDWGATSCSPAWSTRTTTSTRP